MIVSLFPVNAIWVNSYADGEQVESQNLAQLQSDGRVFGRGSGGFL